jgi:hypothetical protein
MPEAAITSYAVADLLSWRESGALEISPKFQRRSVWSPSAKGHFIDSILLEYAVPPIHIRLAVGLNRKLVREVIDGQQRMRSVFDFISGDFRIPKGVSENWGGKGYEQLTDSERSRINLFSFVVYQYKELTDQEVLDMFARLNTYSVGLSAQELRNGRWFGEFKRQSYALATEALQFWRRHGIFTEQQIARMREAELVSELLIAQLDGLQDKKTSVDVFYENLDEKWTQAVQQWPLGRGSSRLQPDEYLSARESSKRFRSTIAAIDNAAGDILRESPFSRPALFYTLYCAVYHINYGLPRSGRLPLGAVGLGETRRLALRRAIGELTEFSIDRVPRSPALSQFYDASTRQTDNLAPRTDRLHALVKLISRSR